MILQTSAKMVATLSIADAIAFGAGVLAFWGRPAIAQSTGELSPRRMMSAGWLAIAVPPIRVVDGRRVVVASASESEWTVKFGPFLGGAECGSVLSGYSRGALHELATWYVGNPYLSRTIRLLVCSGISGPGTTALSVSR